MGRAYTSVIPPEYQTVATQVTNYGAPKYKALTRQNYGTIGRSVMDTNQLQNQGSGSEVYNNQVDPLTLASATTAEMVQDFKRQFSATETPNTNIDKVVDKTKVTYNPDISRDAQVSNVRGMQFTGDPETVGQAMKYHGSEEFEAGRTLDGSDIQATIDRAASGMDKASRSQLAEAISNLGPEALESLPSTDLAGLNEGVSIAGTGSIAGLPTGSTGVLPPRSSIRSAAARRVIRGRPQKKDLPYRHEQKSKQDLPLIRKSKNDDTQTDFNRLAAQRALESKAAMRRRPQARVHPAQSNYVDPHGQKDTTSKKGREEDRKKEIQRQLQLLKSFLQEAWKDLTPSQRKEAQKFVAAASKRWMKMTSEQRRRAISHLSQMIKAYRARIAAAKKQKQLEAASRSSNQTSDDLQIAADAQNGDVEAQKKINAKEKQAAARKALLDQLERAWKRYTANLTTAQKNQLRKWFVTVQKAWIRMSPEQRRQAIIRLREQVRRLQVAAAQAVRKKQAAKKSAVSTGPATPGVGSEDTKTTVDSETGMATAVGQNGDTVLQDRSQFQAKERKRAMQQLMNAWSSAAKRLTPKQKQRLRAWLKKMQQAWLSMTPQQRRQALVQFRKQVYALQKAARREAERRKEDITSTTSPSDPSAAGPGIVDEDTEFDASELYSDEGYWNGPVEAEGDAGYWDQGDITSDSEGFVASESSNTKWIIGGAVVAAGITGLMLFASPKKAK